MENHQKKKRSLIFLLFYYLYKVEVWKAHSNYFSIVIIAEVNVISEQDAQTRSLSAQPHHHGKHNFLVGDDLDIRFYQIY